MRVTQYSRGRSN